MHIYEKIPLHAAAYTLSVLLIFIHAWALFKQDTTKKFLEALPRNTFVGSVLIIFGMSWFLLLVAPIKTPFSLHLAEFEAAKKILLFAIPVTTFYLIKEANEFLSIRALGLLGLLSATPLLAAAWQEPPSWRILIPSYSYIVIILSLFIVGMPYLFRDFVNWLTAKSIRFTLAALGGLTYGLILLGSALIG